MERKEVKSHILANLFFKITLIAKGCQQKITSCKEVVGKLGAEVSDIRAFAGYKAEHV